MVVVVFRSNHTAKDTIIRLYFEAVQGVDFTASCWRGHFNKLLYEDFGVYIEQIVVRSERAMRA